VDTTEILNELQRINVILESGVVNSWGNRILKTHLKLYNIVYSFTSGFNEQSLSERIYCIRNNITAQPICPECGNPIVNFNTTLGYTETCSVKCANNKETKKQQIIKTNDTRYGGHPRKTEEVKKKFEQTCIERYGVPYPIQSEEIKAKQKQTNNLRYDADYYHQSIKGKLRRTKTNLKKYGVDFPFQSNIIQDKVKASVAEKYGVTSTAKLDFVKIKTKQTCNDKYFVDFVSQRNYSIETLEKLSSKEWLETNYEIKTTRQLADELNVDKKTISTYLKNHDILIKSYGVSVGEKEVQDFIHSLGVLTINNTFDIIPPYELDIYVPEHNLAIEYCGLYWHSEAAGKDKTYHKMKHDMCRALGIQLLTIFEDEWVQRLAQVKSKIKSLLNKDESCVVYARKTTIVNVSLQSKNDFYDINHIQSTGQGSINIGLVSNSSLVACMSFIKRNTDTYELSRYATSCRVIGGFSKLLKFFIREYEPSSIISFADLRWSTGNLYIKTGWEVDKILPPDYSYSPDGKLRFHKFNYRRKNLPKLLKDFDPDLSERINCDNNGILRIWDCGKIRFKYNC